MATAVSRWEPATGIALRDAMNQLFEDSFVQPFGRVHSGSSANYLPLDIYETDEAYVVKGFLPGVSAENVEITTQQNTVTIHAQQPAEQDQTESFHYHLRERPTGPWTRSFELPAAIDSNNIDAQLQNGVLVLTLPKAPEARPHKVNIRSN